VPDALAADAEATRGSVDKAADGNVPSVRGVPEMRFIMRRTGLTISEIKTFTGEKTLMNAVALVLHTMLSEILCI
jgi:hypothetical protein